MVLNTYQGQIKKFSYLTPNEPEPSEAEPKGSPAMNRKQKQWEDRLNANKAGAQASAEEFTKEFMYDMYSEQMYAKETSLMKKEEAVTKKSKAVILGNLNTLVSPVCNYSLW